MGTMWEGVLPRILWREGKYREAMSTKGWREVVVRGVASLPDKIVIYLHLADEDRIFEFYSARKYIGIMWPEGNLVITTMPYGGELVVSKEQLERDG